MKTKLEIIEETVAYYSEDVRRRAAKGGSDCQYYDNETGAMCAVGRCMTNPKEYAGVVINAEDLIAENPQVLKAEYQGHEAEFWEDIQHLHDSHWYWSDEGITERGLRRVEQTKERWANN